MTTNTSRVVGIPFFGSPERICEGAGQIFVGEKQNVGFQLEFKLMQNNEKDSVFLFSSL